MSERLIHWPALFESLPAEGSVCIEASAGSGKTYTLEHLVLRMVLLEGLGLPEILVVTFTEKATLELRDRLRGLIGSVLARLYATASTDRAALLLESGLPPEAEARAQQALRDFDRAAIYTIHGFCQQTLAEQALSTGLPLQQQLVPAGQLGHRLLLDQLRLQLGSPSLAGQALRQLLSQEPASTLMALFKQWLSGVGEITPAYDLEALHAAARAFPNDDEVLAWGQATYGKRARKTHEGMVGLLQALPKAALAMSPELLLQPGNPWEACFATKVGSSLAINALFKQLFTLHPTATSGQAGQANQPSPQTQALQEAVQRLMDHRPTLYGLLCAELFEQVQAEAEHHKAALGLVDYHDMLTRLDQALDPVALHAEELLQAVRGRYRCALIDEFQDTDALQWRIFSRLFVESPAHRVVVVGDPKQAIYGFRGGDLPVYLAAREQLGGPEAAASGQEEARSSGQALLRLGTSYRSSQALLGLLGALFEADYFEDQGLGAPPLAASPDPPRLLDAKGKDLPAMMLFTAPNDNALWGQSKRDTARAVLESLVGEIHQLMGTGPGEAAPSLDSSGIQSTKSCAQLAMGGDPLPRPLRHSDIMVLCLTGGQCEQVGQALGEAGIPFSLFKRGGLGESRQAEQLKLLLESLCNPEDRRARARLWLTDFFGLPLAKVEQAQTLPADHPLLALPRRWSQLAARRDFERLFEAVMTESGLSSRLAQAGDERALTNFGQLTELLLEAARTEALATPDLLTTLDSLSQDEGSDDRSLRRLETEREVVQVLTLHASKGLEAPVVLLGFPPAAKISNGLEWHPDKEMPHFYKAGTRRRRLAKRPSRLAWNLEEKAVNFERESERRRLFYVAATRAMVRLGLPVFLPVPENAAAADASGKKLKFVTGYEALNARLVRLLEDPSLSDSIATAPLGGASPEEGEDGTAAPAPDGEAAASVGPRGPAPRQGDVPAASRSAQDPSATPGRDYSALLRAHMAPIISSYSRIKRGHGEALRAVAELSLEDKLDELEPTIPAEAPEAPESGLTNANSSLADNSGADDSASINQSGAPGHQPYSETANSPSNNVGEETGGEVSAALTLALPPGRRSGLFLHSLLELADFSAVANCQQASEWLAQGDTHYKLTRLAGRYGLGDSTQSTQGAAVAVAAGATLAHAVLRAPLQLGKHALPGGLANLQRHRAELLFYAALPEASHPLLDRALRSLQEGADPNRPFRARRGFLTGSIDLVFEHEDRVFFLDWKSDRLPAYDPASLKLVVEDRYALQAQIYSLALTRHFELSDAAAYEAHFGGFVYLFLRAFDPQPTPPSRHAPAALATQAAHADDASPAIQAITNGVYFERPSFEALASYERDLLQRRELGGPSLPPLTGSPLATVSPSQGVHA